MEQGTVPERRVNRIKAHVLTLRWELFFAAYSGGYPLRECREIYMQILQTDAEVWNTKQSYVDFLWCVALGVLFEVDTSAVEKLKLLIRKNGCKDRLISRLLHSLDPAFPLETRDCMPEPYRYAADLWDMDPEKATKAMEDYLNKHWYQGHVEMGWYDSHKRTNNTYVGYWSLEAAAILKILRLNDDVFKNAPYYPYDLAHFRADR